jgi:hypothetical protein
LHFGPDGRLYVAVGENALGAPAQSMTSHKGKILRLAADGAIPTDNPFYATATGTYRAIWALGLRNPFTFAFQPGSTRVFINDVGENAWEEIDVGAAGANYGWPATEGSTSNPAYVSPLFAYPQGSGASAGCAITGGVFYHPATATFPAEYVGNYLFADFCSGWVRRLDPVTGAVLGQLASGLAEPVDLDVSAAGDLYVLSHGGVVTRISRSSGAAPVITTPPSSLSVAPGQSASLSVAASGAPPLTYQWQRDEVNLPGVVLTVTDAGGSSVTLHRDLAPVTTVFTLRTSPPGLALTLGGQPVTDGAQITGVVGMVRAVGAPSPQSAPGGPYVFASWSDGGAAVHDLVTPPSATTYTATFVATPGPTPPPPPPEGATALGTRFRNTVARACALQVPRRRARRGPPRRPRRERDHDVNDGHEGLRGPVCPS